MKKAKGWLAVGAVSVVSNVAFFAVANRFPNGPVGRLKRLLLSNASTAPAKQRTAA